MVSHEEIEMGKTIKDLLSPVALVDVGRLENNIEEMASKAKENGVQLRPHIKTHKCIEIGKKQEKAGSTGITVSTPAEAIAFAESGFRDITYAVPIAPDKFRVVHEISKKTDLKLLVDNKLTIELLEEYCQSNDAEFRVLLKVNSGNDRVGVDPNSQIGLKLVRLIEDAKNVDFEGILAHAGHSYSSTSLKEIQTIAEHEQRVMVKFAKDLKNEDPSLEPRTVSIGSTPTTRLAKGFMEGITEIRPGNYVFFDYTQVALGVCDYRDVAFTVQASVISIHAERVVIDAGATALSKDRGATHIEDYGYGKIVKSYSEGTVDKDLILASLSQEHGKISVQGDNNLKPGDRLRIIPNHSCLTANLYDYFHVVKGDDVVDSWKVHRGHLIR